VYNEEKKKRRELQVDGKSITKDFLKSSKPLHVSA
jgi:hypothetical protein